MLHRLAGRIFTSILISASRATKKKERNQVHKEYALFQRRPKLLSFANPPKRFMVHLQLSTALAAFTHRTRTVSRQKQRKTERWQETASAKKDSHKSTGAAIAPKKSESESVKLSVISRRAARSRLSSVSAALPDSDDEMMAEQPRLLMCLWDVGFAPDNPVNQWVAAQ